MSGEALYERYKDALRRGHIASIQGRLEEALDAYAEAARIAPERATPHSSAGTALLRRRRAADALRCFEAALQVAPADEASMVGRAESLAAMDRPSDAADAWSGLADHRIATGRTADAVDAARRALELAEGRGRRRALERLIVQLRASEPDEPGRAALERALRVLEGVAVARPAAPGVSSPVAPWAVSPSGEVVVPSELVRAETSVAGEGAPVPVLATPEPGVEAVPPTPPAPVVPGALDRELPADLDLDALARAAEASVDALDRARAVQRLLDLAAAQHRAGNRDAALDACYRGLLVGPDDLGLHLALVELYADRGWTALATEKLDLLERIAVLDGDPEARTRVAAGRDRVA